MIAAVGGYLKSFWGEEAFEMFIKYSYRFGAETYEFARDENDIWTGAWHSPDDLQIEEDLARPSVPSYYLDFDSDLQLSTPNGTNPFQ